jgi:hypothetical protein
MVMDCGALKWDIRELLARMENGEWTMTLVYEMAAADGSPIACLHQTTWSSSRMVNGSNTIQIMIINLAGAENPLAYRREECPGN